MVFGQQIIVERYIIEWGLLEIIQKALNGRKSMRDLIVRFEFMLILLASLDSSAFHLKRIEVH